MGTKTKQGKYYRGEHEQSIIAKRRRAKGKGRKVSKTSRKKDAQVKAVKPVKSGYSYLGDAKTTPANKTVGIKSHKRLVRTGKGGLDYKITTVKAHKRKIHSKAKKTPRKKSKTVPQRITYMGHYYSRKEKSMTTQAQVKSFKDVWAKKGYSTLVRKYGNRYYGYARKPEAKPKGTSPKKASKPKSQTEIPDAYLSKTEKGAWILIFKGQSLSNSVGINQARRLAEKYSLKLPNKYWDAKTGTWKAHREASKTAPKPRSPPKTSKTTPKRSKGIKGSKLSPVEITNREYTKKIDGDYYTLEVGYTVKADANRYAELNRVKTYKNGQPKWSIRVVKAPKGSNANWLVYQRRQEYNAKWGQTKSKSKAKGGSERASPKYFNGLRVATSSIKYAETRPPVKVKYRGNTYYKTRYYSKNRKDMVERADKMMDEAMDKGWRFTPDDHIKKIGDYYYLYIRKVRK